MKINNLDFQEYCSGNLPVDRITGGDLSSDILQQVLSATASVNGQVVSQLSANTQISAIGTNTATITPSPSSYTIAPGSVTGSSKFQVVATTPG